MSSVADIVDRLLTSLNNRETFDKFRRIKMAGLQKRHGESARMTMPGFSLLGFSQCGQHLVWHESAEALLKALVFQTIFAEAQQRFQKEGARAFDHQDG